MIAIKLSSSCKLTLWHFGVVDDTIQNMNVQSVVSCSIYKSRLKLGPFEARLMPAQRTTGSVANYPIARVSGFGVQLSA